MSNLTRDATKTGSSRRRRSDPRTISPRVREVVDDLNTLCDEIEAGRPLEQVARVRVARINLTVPVVTSDDVRTIRESLGLNQAMFAEFLGIGQTTLRRWEHGQVVPSALARRLLGQVCDDPSYWRKKLRGQG